MAHAQTCLEDCLDCADDRRGRLMDRTRWRLSNAGQLTWRPGVRAQFYSDADCKNKIEIPADNVTLSNWRSNVHGTYENAVACAIQTNDCSWRPAWPHLCERCTWIQVEFPAPVNILCAKGQGMGVSTGNYQWDGGVVLQVGYGDGWLDVSEPTIGSDFAVAAQGLCPIKVPQPSGLTAGNSSKRCPRGATCDDGACGLVLLPLVHLCTLMPVQLPVVVANLPLAPCTDGKNLRTLRDILSAQSGGAC